MSSLRPSTDETDRQRKDALRQKVGLKTLPPFILGIAFLFSIDFFLTLQRLSLGMNSL